MPYKAVFPKRNRLTAATERSIVAPAFISSPPAASSGLLVSARWRRRHSRLLPLLPPVSTSSETRPSGGLPLFLLSALLGYPKLPPPALLRRSASERGPMVIGTITISPEAVRAVEWVSDAAERWWRRRCTMFWRWRWGQPGRRSRRRTGGWRAPATRTS